ncbi:MAG: ATP-binding cassette domain-containing protein [Acidiferrobacterales bacterium]|nr:ATP-binding cassette domain-containing protein [Gammaproteobacteria bacterium]
MSEVVLTNVTKSWGDDVAVNDVSITAEQGMLLVLLGPSGCGKSTTLRLIAGLEDVTSGIVYIGGRDATWLPPAPCNVSMVFQSYVLFCHLAVAENIIFGLKVRRVNGTERANSIVTRQAGEELLALRVQGRANYSRGAEVRLTWSAASDHQPLRLVLDDATA